MSDFLTRECLAMSVRCTSTHRATAPQREKGSYTACWSGDKGALLDALTYVSGIDTLARIIYDSHLPVS